ncbi:MAG TPA: DUF6542 domain-containing protein [Jatrophihabitans sp.]
MQSSNGATYVPEKSDTSYFEGFGGSGNSDDYDEAVLSGADRPPRRRRSRPTERGLPGWLAVLLLLAIAGIGGLIDQVSGASIQGAFNYGLIFASLVAIVVVKRSQMFSVVIAPPLVYFAGSAVKLYISSGGLHSRSALIDAASNWLVYGFPAIAGATAIVLVIGGIRMIIHK